MSDRDHRGYDPDAYNSGDGIGETLKRDCPLCGAEDIQLPHHLPCDGVEASDGDTT